MADPTPDPRTVVEDVEVSGHIIDSLILPKALDCITGDGGSFRIKQISVGQTRNDPSFALVEVQAATTDDLDTILSQIADHGAVPTAGQDARLAPADIAGAFPEGFYSTTNHRTEVRHQGQWIPVSAQEMDCVVLVDEKSQTARCVAMTDIECGMQVIVGHAGVRVFPPERPETGAGFAFMSSSVSTEKPKGAMVREIARELVEIKKSGGKTLLVGGPAIVHTGSGPSLCDLIRNGFINKLFAGNALATHDIEQAIFGTSLGVHLEDAQVA